MGHLNLKIQRRRKDDAIRPLEHLQGLFERLFKTVTTDHSSGSSHLSQQFSQPTEASNERSCDGEKVNGCCVCHDEILLANSARTFEHVAHLAQFCKAGSVAPPKHCLAQFRFERVDVFVRYDR